MSFQPTPLWNPVEVTPPWGWNPAATFLTAYTSMQENKREQQDMQMAAELQRILLPAKAAEAEFNIKKFAYDSQLLEKIYRTKSAALDNSYRGVTSAIGSTGSGSTVPGSGNNVQPSRYGGGVADLIKAYQSGGRPPASGGGKTLGSGLTGDE